ncbi:MAG: hypothetical protein GXW96_06045, partial [Christensenellaceae bacterium]|nr:hypothetical protein [Christensenellaceae bacterium]
MKRKKSARLVLLVTAFILLTATLGGCMSESTRPVVVTATPAPEPTPEPTPVPTLAPTPEPTPEP